MVDNLLERKIRTRAAELAKRDGFEWQLDYKPVSIIGTQVKTVLDEPGRQKYLEQARQELEHETGDA